MCPIRPTQLAFFQYTCIWTLQAIRWNRKISIGEVCRDRDAAFDVVLAPSCGKSSPRFERRVWGFPCCGFGFGPRPKLARNHRATNVFQRPPVARRRHLRQRPYARFRRSLLVTWPRHRKRKLAVVGLHTRRRKWKGRVGRRLRDVADRGRRKWVGSGIACQNKHTGK